MWKFGNLAAGRGEKVKGYLEFPGIQERLPAFLINGEEDGPATLIFGGIHGCEYTSIDAALTLGRKLSAEDVKGKVAVLPIANPASFYARSIYVHPDDKKNLNRVFPGKKDGTAAERLAFFLTETAFKPVEYIIDLHGGDMIEALVPFTIYHKGENQELAAESRQLASAMGIEYIVGSTDQVGGSTYSSASFQGKKAIIAEAGQQGILDRESSLLLQEGTKNALRHIGNLSGTAEDKPTKLLNTFDWYRADHKGLWYPSVSVGDAVKKGDLVGKITDEFGDSLKEYHANTDGIILFLVTSLAINLDDPLLAVGD